ncbi:MAG: Bax inhibitor-1 family protein [Nostoc sp. ChiSLP01]|uniref:US12 family protein n=1 Tax=Nostoc paludosum FACHB-159 TaxID=2692908 RepID=A0ABR8K4I9_9NOSO|nr:MULTISPECIES: Bax inhibitor-1 family protein [Nostoc]MBD2678086.1 US12 family protein [Nostoc sp. FACHB-857]MBD2734346.1 US12 family protein [Nostoc paludosum FACHB-159]MDZ8167201.1 Bax inhibitor-1 family protein [Nostoc sp. CmiSLP01]MDZ8287427.1 Bax inhibitor-1 family protein [Nostoc sp. ChiSLP01]
MSNTSNFRQAFREAKTQALIGPNVIAKALPYVGGGLVLTALGTYGGLGVIRTNPQLFFPTFIGAVIVELILFFVAQNVAEKGNKGLALPLLATYSLLSGYTLSGLVFVALGQKGVGIQGIGLAALSCGITFIAARQIGSNLSEQDGMALTKTINIGVIALVVVCFAQFGLAMFGVYTPNWLEIAISGLGVFLFVGASVVDFYILPRAYSDDQYLPVALSMYLTYINLFVFILRLLIAINGRD